MPGYIAPLEGLIEKFRSLPGVGQKTAVRFAFSILDMPREKAAGFAEAILAAKDSIRLCERCQNISDSALCDICGDESRDSGLICVVEDSRAVLAFERTREYRGLYHILHGTLSPQNGVGPDQLKIRELLQRLTGGVSEVIFATNPSVEGEATAMYISRLIAPFGIKASRLALGIPVGGDLEYADEVTLARALEGRKLIDN